ncbi:MAG: CobW family GTP-binding protein, partial [Desulfobulbia bacterium]
MSDVTHVYLITGFLGSGKTTLLNRIIQRFPKDKKLTLLVNEFGEVGVDGTLVEGDDIDMMEISKGSIFCVCVKTDFIKGLYELNSKVRPDVMLIESTGVANPSDLKKDLKLPIFNERFHFMEQFCVIDAAHFLDAYDVYASLEKQIASSTVFIINKIDNAPSETIEETKNVIRQFHPNPSFFETTYADIPLADYFDFAKQESTDFEASEPEKVEVPALSEEALDQFIDELLDSPDLEITPPDTLMSVTYSWNGD